MFFEIYLFVLCSLILLYFYFANNGKYKELNEKFGGYKNIPIFGVAFTIFNLKELMYKWPSIVKNLKLKSAFVWFGPGIPVFYTYNREYAQKILLSPDCNSKSFNYKIISKEMGRGLVSVRGPVWKRHRKLLNPLFSHRFLIMNFIPDINKYSSAFLRELENVAGNGEIELFPMLIRNTIRTSVAFQMDLELKDDNKQHVLFIDHLIHFLVTLEERMSNWLHSYDSFFRWSKLYQPYSESKNFVLDFINKIVQNEIIAKNCKTNYEQTDNGSFLKQIVDIHLKGDLSMQEVVSECLTLLFGSFDTATLTLEAVILSLAMNPEYQEKLFNEVQSFYPDKDFDVKYEDFQHLVYMDQFLNETFRLFSIVPQLGRLVTKDVQISDDIVIPSGTNIVIDVFKLHKDEDIWGPNAKKFNPDHFSPENLRKIPPYAFIPLSKGPRDCIGSRYANIFLKTNLAKMVRNFRFETKVRFEDLHFWFFVFLKPKDAPLVEVYKR